MEVTEETETTEEEMTVESATEIIVKEKTATAAEVEAEVVTRKRKPQEREVIAIDLYS